MRPTFAIAPAVIAAGFVIVGCQGDKESKENPERGQPSVKNELKPAKLLFVDLQSKANQKLTEPFHSGRKGNDLSELPTGKQKLGPTTFNVQPGIIQLGNAKIRDKPRAVQGIAVNRKIATLHVLQGTGGSGAARPETAVKDNVQIGEHVVHYEDGTAARIPIVYGVDLRDWWNWDNSKVVSRGKVAWTGKNAYSQSNGKELRLYATTWKNPHPEKKVVKIDFLASNDTPCALFCVAMTAEH